MIDARRWALVEAWLALGLRIEWAPKWERVERDDWQRDEEERTDFYYRGAGVWCVANSDRALRYGPMPTVPLMGVETMRHELAHYLTASEEQRGQRNFGLTPKDNEAEERALEAERVIDAMASAAGRIAGLALAGGRP